MIEAAPDQPLGRRRQEQRLRHDQVRIEPVGEPGAHQLGRGERDRGQAVLGAARGDVHRAERLGAGVGEHQPRRRGRLGRGEIAGEVEPVDRDLGPGHGERRPRGPAVGTSNSAPPSAKRSRVPLCLGISC